MNLVGQTPYGPTADDTRATTVAWGSGTMPEANRLERGQPAAASVPDGYRPAWNAFAGSSSPGETGSAAGAAQGGFFDLINSLIGQLNAIVGQVAGEANAEGPATQTVADATFASTGDPHLSEKATLLGPGGQTTSVDRHFDSMTDHANLVSSRDFDGGYRLSTTVTAPNAQGVTLNASATVHLDSDRENVTLRNDGSYSIADDGKAVMLDAGQTTTLGHGAVVTRNTDGSLTVVDRNPYGGTAITTLAAKGGGVDATTAMHNVSVGGDIAGHADAVAPQRSAFPNVFG